MTIKNREDLDHATRLKVPNLQLILTLLTKQTSEIPIKSNAKTSPDHENEGHRVQIPTTTDDRKTAEVHTVPMIAVAN